MPLTFPETDSIDTICWKCKYFLNQDEMPKCELKRWLLEQYELNLSKVSKTIIKLKLNFHKGQKIKNLGKTPNLTEILSK